MNIAICLSGGIKYPEKSLSSIKHILPNDNVKVFIHTWEIDNVDSYKSSSFANKMWNKDFLGDLSILNDYKAEDILLEKYSVKEKDFQLFFKSLNFSSYPRQHIMNIEYDVAPISMCYSIFKSNQLKSNYEKKNNMIFDKVVRMRFDTEFYEDLNILNLSDNLNIPSGRDWSEIGVNDQFAVASSKEMDIYCDLINHFHDLQHLPYHSETLLFGHINNKISIDRFDFEIKINNGI